MGADEVADSERAELLGKIAIFASLSADDRLQLARICGVVIRNAGDVIFTRGDPPHAMYVIVSGRIDISVWGEDRREIVLSVLHAGDFFGEVALLGQSARTATAKAIERSELLEIPADPFFDLLRSRPGMAIALLENMAARLRATTELIEHPVTRNPNDEIEEHLGFGDRVADRVAQFGGSWRFLLSMLGTIGVWVAINLWALAHPFDPYPFILLNLFLSLLAGLQAPVIMMSQNRQSVKDRLHAELDYKVNLKAELQIQSLHLKIDELRGSQLREVSDLQRSQIAVLREQIEMLNRLLQTR